MSVNPVHSCSPAVLCLLPRSVPDSGSNAVPRWLGLRQGPAVLRPRRLPLPRRPLLHGLGLLHGHGRHRAHLCLRRLLGTGRDRHFKRQSPGGDRGGEKPHLPPLSQGKERRMKKERLRGYCYSEPALLNVGWPMKRRPLLLFTTKTPLCVFCVVLVWDTSTCQVLSSQCVALSFCH